MFRNRLEIKNVFYNHFKMLNCTENKKPSLQQRGAHRSVGIRADVLICHLPHFFFDSNTVETVFSDDIRIPSTLCEGIIDSDMIIRNTSS